ncbi:11547_t:CDS:1, partial [Ambispora gerdemannii]
LIDLFTNGQIKDLKDYVLGVEVGLDTHSRKNRGGLLMENGVEKLLIDYQVEYKKQVTFALS